MSKKTPYGGNQRKVLGTHIITKDVGNLRGFSTYATFLRPSNVAEKAINVQSAPDGTLQLRRGYQCQALQSLIMPSIGGLGLGTLDDPTTGKTKTVTLNTDGNLYQKLTKQIYFNYDGRIMGDITNITNANPAEVTSAGHGLLTGAKVIIRSVAGMTSIGGVDLNNKTFTITWTGVNTFKLNGTDTSTWSAYGAGTGNWSVAFADGRYLSMTIFTDPQYINTVNESITCNVTVYKAAQVVGNLVNVNTINVEFGHELAIGDVIYFYTSAGVLHTCNVLGTTATTILFDGLPVSVSDGTFVSQFFNILFGRGFNSLTVYPISQFITDLTSPTVGSGIYGLQIDSNGETAFPAAFLQIFEPQNIASGSVFTIDYWYWEEINKTIAVTFPGSANPDNQNSPNFENASMAVFDDVIYIANGRDYPQKYDGQTVYRTGMPIGPRPSAIDAAAAVMPFVAKNKYEYAASYEQIDHVGHVIEGEISEVWKHTVGPVVNAAIDVTVSNLTSVAGENWNTNTAIAVGGTATAYGPDSDGYWYHLNTVFPGFTLNGGDSGYYLDTEVARINDPAGILTDVITLIVDAGHGVDEGDEVYFLNKTHDKKIFRTVASVTNTTITIKGDPVTVADNDYIQAYKVSAVFNGVAIVDVGQTQVNTITTKAVNTISPNDVVSFIDSNGRLQRRTVTAAGGASIDIDGNPVDVDINTLISSEIKMSNSVNLRRSCAVTPHGTTLGTSAPISNNLRINIYRTDNGASFGVNGNLFLVAAIPNNGLVSGTQTITDSLADAETGREFDDPIETPNPPPISKYLKAFGNQLFYAGGEIGNYEHSDLVFFSEGNQAEAVSIATNSFNVPNTDDDITGIGVSGSTLVTTKNQSLWASSGNFISGDINTVQIAPGSNIGCVAHATIASVGSLMYFLHTNGVYSITEGQLYPTDKEGDPIPLSRDIDSIFRTTNFSPNTRYVLKRAVAKNYTKDNQYLLFLPCEDTNTPTRSANSNSIILSYDYQGKNWFLWDNMNAAGGMIVVDDDLYFQSRALAGVAGQGTVYQSSIIANFYKQHRFYRLIDHADHASSQVCEWRSSWDDLGQPEVRKKYCRCVLLLDRISDLYQYNEPDMYFSSYLDRIPNLQSTIATIKQRDNNRNAGWSTSGWGWNYWSGYQDSFITVNLKGGTVAKSIQVGFTMKGINMDIRFAGFQLEAIPENRYTVVR